MDPIDQLSLPDPFLAAAGAVPARGPEARWRQVALLSAAAALGDAARVAPALASALLALDRPGAALAALERADGDDAWVHWWRILAHGQLGDSDALERVRSRPTARPGEGPDAREVSRRLDDLAAELAVLRAAEPRGDARFAVLGHRARPERRMLLAGRSSAVYLVEPGWDAVRLLRFGPPEGTAAGNRAVLSPPELIGAVRRGESGAGREVPGDVPLVLEPGSFIEALREDVAARDRRLIALAREVADERERLREERARLADDREAFDLECAGERMRRARATPSVIEVAPPRTHREALTLLGLAPGAGPVDVERAWREQVVLCHPDRVGGLHASLRAHAEGLTAALNTARDLLAGAGTGRSRR